MKTKKQTVIYKNFQSLRNAFQLSDSDGEQTPADKVSFNELEGKKEPITTLPDSEVRCHKIFTAEKSIVKEKISTLLAKDYSMVFKQILSLLNQSK